MKTPETTGIAPGAEPGESAAAALERALNAADARESLADFVRYGWHVLHPDEPLIWGWHLDETCRLYQLMLEELLRARRDPGYVMREQNMLTNVPPRSTKTEIFQVFGTAWLWLHDPRVKIRCLSGNAAVTDDASRATRVLIGSEWYQTWFRPAWTINHKRDGVHAFANTVGGVRLASGMLSEIIGTGTDILIVDDPHDAQAADSELKRETTLSRWDKVIRNRLNNPRARLRIGVMQRLHELDWAGHVLSKGGWVHVKIPMEFEVFNPCKCETCSGAREHDAEFYVRDPRTEAGQLMAPDRFDRAFCDAERAELSEYGYAGQMQQRPSPDEGGMFKRDAWRFWKPDGTAAEEQHPRPRGCYTGPARALPKLHETVISADLTFGSKTKNGDYVAIFVIGSHHADRYVLDMRVGKMSYPETKDAMRELCALYPRAYTKIVEKAANGQAIIDELNSEVGGVIPFTVAERGPKEARAHVMSPGVQAGNWFLPEGAPWLDAFVEQFATFPNAAHDDMVDACSQAAIYFLESGYAALLEAAYG